MEFDLDEYLLGSDLPAEPEVEPSNTKVGVPALAEDEHSGRSRRESRRRRRLVASGQAGPFTGTHGEGYHRVVPPAWNLTPNQYRRTTRRERDALNGVRRSALTAGGLGLGGPTSVWLAAVEPGAVTAIPDIVLAVMFGGGIVASISALIWGPTLVKEAREDREHDWSVLRERDPSHVVNLRRLPHEVASLLETIADGPDPWAKEPTPTTPERQARLSVTYRLAAAMMAAVEADLSLPEDDGRTYNNKVALSDLYRLCPDELRELIETGIAMGDRFAAAAGSIQGQMTALDRASHGPAPTTTSSAATSARPSSPPPAIARGGGTTHPTLDDRWEAALATHDAVVEAWTAIVTDPLAALDHSLLLDVTQPRTAAFIEAYGHAQDLRAVHGTVLPADNTQQVAYFAAVRKADEAWTEAVRYAKHVNLSWLPDKEAGLVRKATALLASAGDDAQPLHVRAEAAAKASHLLGKVTSFLLPPMAMHALEASRRLALPSPAQP